MAKIIQFPVVRRIDRFKPATLDDLDLAPGALLLWIASAARVALAVEHHELWGAEATLAFACAIALPWFVVKRAVGFFGLSSVPGRSAKRAALACAGASSTGSAKSERATSLRDVRRGR